MFWFSFTYFKFLMKCNDTWKSLQLWTLQSTFSLLWLEESYRQRKNNKYNQMHEVCKVSFYQIKREKFCWYWNLLSAFGKELKAMSKTGCDIILSDYEAFLAHGVTVLHLLLAAKLLPAIKFWALIQRK